MNDKNYIYWQILTLTDLSRLLSIFTSVLHVSVCSYMALLSASTITTLFGTLFNIQKMANAPVSQPHVYVQISHSRKVSKVNHALYTAQNTKTSPNPLVWKFSENVQFPQSSGRLVQNSAEAVRFHKLPTPGN